MRVYRDASDRAVLLMYRRVSNLYIVLTYARRRAVVTLETFSALLDAIPVRSVVVPGPVPPLHESLDATVECWRRQALSSLQV